MRGWSLTMSLLLSTVALAQAGTQFLAWDYPLAWQSGTTYVLQITVQRGGPSLTSEQPLPFLSPQSCTALPVTERTVDTLCGSICLPPGDYSLTLFALPHGQRSSPSNVLDLDLTSTTPCPGSAPAPASPPASSPGGAVAGGVVAGGAVAASTRRSVAAAPPENVAWTDLLNFNCVSWKITGACVCGFPPHPCVTVEYFEPGWLVETVKVPGSTTLAALGPIINAALSQAGATLPAGGAGNASGTGHTNLHFGDVHVFPFPQLLGGPCTSCAPSMTGLLLHYASELDPAWRTAVAVPSPLNLLQKIGVWHALYPRGGKVIHGSPVVASAVEAVRGLDITDQPVGTPPQPDVHVVLQPAPGITGLGCCMQLASPKQTPCFMAGTPPPLWDHGLVSRRGTYLFVIWRRRLCCVEATNTTCGITVPGVGGQGANTCALTPPSP